MRKSVLQVYSMTSNGVSKLGVSRAVDDSGVARLEGLEATTTGDLALAMYAFIPGVPFAQLRITFAPGAMGRDGAEERWSWTEMELDRDLSRNAQPELTTGQRWSWTEMGRDGETAG